MLSFAEKAFRHPLSDEEQSAITGQFWTEMTAAGATLGGGARYGVYGILSSPSFLYRTEFGADVAADGPLTPYELASAISLFLTDAPSRRRVARRRGLERPRHARPDPRPGDAPARDAGGARQPRERAHQVLLTHQGAGRRAEPGGDAGPYRDGRDAVVDLPRGRAVHEEPALVRTAQRSSDVAADLDQRRDRDRRSTASPRRSEVDADGFGLVDLPDDRSGLLTLSTFLLAGARSTGGSPVARGLAVNGSVVCEVNPPFPAAIRTWPPRSRASRGDSELEKAQFRAAVPKCAACHLNFDAFGMVLEPYDAVGRVRTADLEGRPIDASWTTTALPQSVGGAMVTSAAETGRALATSGALDRCMAMNFINYGHRFQPWNVAMIIDQINPVVSPQNTTPYNQMYLERPCSRVLAHRCMSRGTPGEADRGGSALDPGSTRKYEPRMEIKVDQHCRARKGKMGTEKRLVHNYTCTSFVGWSAGNRCFYRARVRCGFAATNFVIRQEK